LLQFELTEHHASPGMGSTDQCRVHEFEEK
jgi:hypothetical protein